MEPVQIEALVGATPSQVVRGHDRHRYEWLVLFTDRGIFGFRTTSWDGWIEDVVGDLSDLIGAPITRAEQVYHTWPDVREVPGSPDPNYDWTFQVLETARGDVTLRWCETPVEYYAVEVEVYRLSECPIPVVPVVEA